MTCDKNEMESVYCKPGIFALSKYLPMRNLKIGFFFFIHSNSITQRALLLTK